MREYILPYDDVIDIACEASTEAWHRLNKALGDRYVDNHYNELISWVHEYVESRLKEEETNYLRSKEEISGELYYKWCELSYDGWHQQDIIDMYRRER